MKYVNKLIANVHTHWAPSNEKTSDKQSMVVEVT